MILFMNVFITSNPLTRVDRGISPYAKRDDVFKYMISSLAAFDFSRVFICFDVDEMYKDSVSDIVAHIREHFPKAFIEPRRLMRMQDWRTFINDSGMLEGREFIFHAGNDDHIFIDRDFNVFNACMQVAEFCRDTVTEFVSVGYSHWPEYMLSWDNLFLHDDRCSAVYTKCLPRESTHIVSPEVLRQFFFPTEGALGDDALIRRTDNLGAVVPGILVRPHRELFRHFDAYSHVGIPISAFPPLTIPPGYFERDIRLIFDDRSSDLWSNRDPEVWTNVSVYSEAYRATDVRGAHLKCAKSGLPHHWRGRISDMVDTSDDPQTECAREDLEKLEDLASVLPVRPTEIRRLMTGAFNMAAAEAETVVPSPLRLWAHKLYVGSGDGTALVMVLKDGPYTRGVLPSFMKVFAGLRDRHGLELILLIVGASDIALKPSFYLTLSHFPEDEHIAAIYSYAYPTGSGGCGVDPLKLLLAELPHQNILIFEQKFYSAQRLIPLVPLQSTFCSLPV